MAASKKKLLTVKFYVCLRGDETGKDKFNKIEKFLDDGVNIDEQFGNDSNNTPLHISVMKEDLVLVDLLLKRGAKTNYKNEDDKTALDIALQLNSDVGSVIVNLLTSQAEPHTNVAEEVNLNAMTDKYITGLGNNNQQLAYRKRGGTSGIKGQIYVPNLLSLIFIRASLKNNFEEFYLGTGLHMLESLNDVCLRYKRNNEEGVLFLQTKFKGEGRKGKITHQDLWRPEGDFSLHKYFDNYLLILCGTICGDARDNVMFKTGHEDMKHSIVIYTTAECDIKEKFITNVDSMDKNIRDLILTGDVSNIYKYNYNEEDIALLANENLICHMECIGKALAIYISARNVDNLLSNSSIQKYHIVLAHKVLIISEIMPDGFRLGGFRKDFLYSVDDPLLTLKFTLFKTLIEMNIIDKTKLSQLVKDVRLDPSVITLSKLMQYIPTYFNQYHTTLYVRDERFKDVTYILQDVKVGKGTYNEAFQLSLNEVLGKIYIPLPSRFGNVDIPIENEKNRKKILENQADAILQFLEQQGSISNSKRNLSKQQVSYDLQAIWSFALGNLLILDENTNLLKFNMNEKSLYKNAKTLLKMLKSKIQCLDEVAFKLDLKALPKLKLDSEEVEKYRVRTFFDNLWFYTSQSAEDEIEDHAIDLVQDYYIANKEKTNKNFSNARYEAIYFLIREAVQKWWMANGISYYITNSTVLIDKLLIEISGKSMLNIISCMFITKMCQFGVKFNKDAIDCLQTQIKAGVILLITDASILTGIKLAQCFVNTNNYNFIDLDNSVNLSKSDYISIVRELKNIKLKALIIFYENITDAKTKIFTRLTEKSVTTDFILVTNKKSAEKLRLYITSDNFEKVTDTRNDLNDLELVSQQKVLDKTFIFQGESVKFSTVMTFKSKNLIKSKILQKILNNELIEIGKILTNPYYEEIKDYIVPRTLRHIKNLSREVSTQKLGTLPNIHDNEFIKITSLEQLKGTVVIVGAPGMGKSTFLTYLSLLTKLQNPSVWIERINLLDQTKELHMLKQKKISKTDALKLVCKALLSRNTIRFSIKPESITNFDLEIENGELVLRYYDEMDVLVLLELEMFVHCYNQGNTILLFDGFDEICPHYKQEMTEILKALVTRCLSNTRTRTNEDTKQRMWITCRSYNNIRETLVTEFRIVYNLEMFTNDEQNLFMKKYFEINLNFDDLNIEHFQNIDAFFEFMKKAYSSDIEKSGLKVNKLSSIFLHILYHTALSHFNSEINKTLRSVKKTFKQNWNLIYNSLQFSYITNNYYYIYQNIGLLKHYGDKKKLKKAASVIFTPLHVYMVLDYFQNQIKDVSSRLRNDGIETWNLDKNTSSFYKYFLETKLKKIRFQEKNQMDIYNPAIAITYEKELKEFMGNHKKLAFFATFKDNLDEIFTDEDVVDIQNIIKGMEAGREKTGIVDCILTGGVPRFVHLSFQEYFAVEYLAEMLKSRRSELTKIWKFILRYIRDGTLDFFDRKLESMDELANITDIEIKQLIYYDIMHVDAKEQCKIDFFKGTILGCALNLGLRDTTRVLLGAMADVVNETNVDKFIHFIKELTVFKSAAILSWDDVLHIILNCIRNVNASKLCEFEPGVLTTVYKKMTNEEIIKDYKWQMKIIIDLNKKEGL